MKRIGFKRKLTKPLKRSPLKKKSKQKISVLKRKLWEKFSLYIRTRDKFTCFVCGRKGEGSSMHAGHFIPKSVGGITLYFNEENVNAECYHCNINLGGNLWEYGNKLGQEKVDRLYQLKNQILKVDEAWYLDKIALYDKKYSELTKNTL